MSIKGGVNNKNLFNSDNEMNKINNEQKEDHPGSWLTRDCRK